MRLIDADALREDMQWAIDHGMYDKPYDYLAEIDDAPTIGEWVPVSERLPNIEQDVLATTTLFGTREVTFAWRINDGEWAVREGNQEAANNDILAWMPLPEPYKESDTE